MATWRIWPATSGGTLTTDATAQSLSTEFAVTQSGCTITGFWFWSPAGGATNAVSFTLWSVTTGTTGTQITAANATSGTLTAGAWNFAACTPTALTANQHYRAEATHSQASSWYSGTNNYWSSGGGASNIVNGPLTAFSNANATGNVQGGFVAGATPAFTTAAFSAGNYWVDVQVDDGGGAPAFPAAAAAPRAPGWHPGAGLPGMPGGIPFTRWQPAGPVPAPPPPPPPPFTITSGAVPGLARPGFATPGNPVTPAVTPAAVMTAAPAYAPGWYPGTAPGMPGGTPFWRPPQDAPVLAAAAVTAAALVPGRPFIARSPAPSRVRTGPAGRPGGGVASAVVTPPGAPARPRPFVFRSPVPARARTGPSGSPGGGVAPAVVTPLGSMPRPMPRPVIQHLPQRRAVTGPRTAGAGIASGIVTPRGTPGPGWRPQPRRPAPARAAWHGNAGPAAVAPAAPQAYQRPAPQVRHPGPSRAVTGPRSRPAGGQAGPAGATPVTATVIRPPAQPRSRPPQRAVWHGGASRVVTPLGPAARRPGPVITSRPRSRGLWHGGTGPVPPPASAPPPRWRPLPARRKAQRGTWRHVAGTANIVPPPVTFALATPGGSPLTAATPAGGTTTQATPSGTTTATATPGGQP